MTCHSYGIAERVVGLLLLLLLLLLLVYAPFWRNEAHKHCRVCVHHPDHGAIRESRSYYKHGTVPEKELVSIGQCQFGVCFMMSHLRIKHIPYAFGVAKSSRHCCYYCCCCYYLIHHHRLVVSIMKM